MSGNQRARAWVPSARLTAPLIPGLPSLCVSGMPGRASVLVLLLICGCLLSPILPAGLVAHKTPSVQEYEPYELSPATGGNDTSSRTSIKKVASNSANGASPDPPDSSATSSQEPSARDEEKAPPKDQWALSPFTGKGVKKGLHYAAGSRSRGGQLLASLAEASEELRLVAEASAQDLEGLRMSAKMDHPGWIAQVHAITKECNGELRMAGEKLAQVRRVLAKRAAQLASPPRGTGVPVWMASALTLADGCCSAIKELRGKFLKERHHLHEQQQLDRALMEPKANSSALLALVHRALLLYYQDGRESKEGDSGRHPAQEEDPISLQGSSRGEWMAEVHLRSTASGGEEAGISSSSSSSSSSSMVAGDQTDPAPGSAGLAKTEETEAHFLLEGTEILRGLKPDAVVAQDGSTEFKTIQAALDFVSSVQARPPSPGAPEVGRPRRRTVVLVRRGVYQERLSITLPWLVLVGEGPEETVIAGNCSHAFDKATAYTSATVAVLADGFMAKGIGFQNMAGHQGRQAIALRVDSDQAAFVNCAFHGYQDTLLAHVGRQYYYRCTVSGSMDFVYGDAAAFFEQCQFRLRQSRNPTAIISASRRLLPISPTGFVIYNSTITLDQQGGEGKRIRTYFGRPWREFARTVVMYSFLDEGTIAPKGWKTWNGDARSPFYAEYKNWGPNADESKRASWARPGQLSERLAPMFFKDRFIGLPALVAAAQQRAQP